MRLSPCRTRLAQAVFVAVLFLFAGILPAMGAQTPENSTKKGAISLPPIRIGGGAGGTTLHLSKETTPSKREAEKLREEELERKDREHRAAREAAAAAREEAAQAKREAEKSRKEELERKNQEHRAAQEAAAAAQEETARAKREAEKLRKEELERKNRERAANPQEAQTRSVAETPKQMQELAYKAGIYAYPLVLSDLVRKADALAAQRTKGVDLFRQFFHSDIVPDIKRASGVIQRADSLYSLAWLELKKSPYLLEIPDMPDRHYLIQILNAWTKNLPAINARDADGKNGKYIFLMQGDKIPADYATAYTPVFCTTSLCMLLARIQVRAPEDISAARKAQQGLRLTPLFPDKLTGLASPSDAAPVQQAAALSAEDFFSRFTGLLADNPAPDRDVRMLGSLARLGIAKGKNAFSSLDEPLREAAADGCRRALADMGVHFNSMSAYNDPLDAGANGWKMSVLHVGTYDERYDMRAHLAAADFGMTHPRDMLQAVLRVDANGKFLDGEQNYVLRFEAGQLPPAEGFWSLTLYTAQQQLNDNKMQRYALTDSSKLVTEADGSTAIYLQQKDPGGKYRGNWLPTPPLGYFSLVLRLYAPGARALNAGWLPPKILPGKKKTTWDSPAQAF